MFRNRFLQLLTLALCLLTPVWWWKVARKRSVASVEFATYNIWNVMFNWEVRKRHIADMIKSHQPAVIGLQEVREANGKSQLEELQALLPAYQWSASQWTTNAVDQEAVKLGRRGIEAGDMYYREGLAILSRWPITKWEYINLTVGDQDKNIRILLTAQVQGPLFPFTFAVTHMSYERKTQCQNAIEIRNHLSTLPKPTILLGDTNTYNDFEDPILYLGSDAPAKSACAQATGISIKEGSEDVLVDAWKITHRTEEGFTFSNMPIPGMESRPDRILLSKAWTLLDVSRDGDGTVYKRDFWWKIMQTRLRTALLNNRECVFDCGPHAKCVCGICVKDASPCHVPCATCVGADKAIVYLFFFPFVLLLIFLVFFFRYSRTPVRKYKTHNLGPIEHGVSRRKKALIILIFTCVWLAVVWKLRHQPVLESLYSLVTGTIPEELFPSDHLFLSASVYYRMT